jgi:hypothetical protein
MNRASRGRAFRCARRRDTALGHDHIDPAFDEFGGHGIARNRARRAGRRALQDGTAGPRARRRMAPLVARRDRGLHRSCEGFRSDHPRPAVAGNPVHRVSPGRNHHCDGPAGPDGSVCRHIRYGRQARTREAARAANDAMPLIENAEAVTVMFVGARESALAEQGPSVDPLDPIGRRHILRSPRKQALSPLCRSPAAPS